MKYMGSKSRIANQIVPIIQQIIDKNNISVYIEPFCGGCNVIDKIKCDHRLASDNHKYLIALLANIDKLDQLPSFVDKEHYSDVRADFNSGSKKYEDWYIGAIGFLASYNGRFFDGGYAKAGYEKTKNGERFRDYYRESKNNLLAQAPYLKKIEFTCKDYTSYNNANMNRFVIYVDPPYQNTKQYANAIKFNYETFWETMRSWSKNNIVLISEQSAPSDFECIWKQEVSRSIKARDKSKSTEKLFTLRGGMPFEL